MIAAVADTHAAIWYVYRDVRLSRRAREEIDRAASAGRYIGVSVISLIEIVYLIEKQRIHPDTFPRLLQTLRDPDEVLIELTIDTQTAEAIHRIPREQVPDLPDRIVAGTALRHGVPVISRDGRIRAADLNTIW